MKIGIKNLFVLSCIVILLIGCKDDTDKGIFSGTYVTQEVEINDVRLFTSAGEIENTTIINSFVERQDKNKYFVKKTAVNSAFFLVSTLKFLSSNEANFTYSVYSNNPTLVNVISQNNVVYLEAKDTVVQEKYIYYDSETIYNKMLTYKVLYADSTQSESDIYKFSIKTKPCYFLTQSDGLFKFPRVSYIYVEQYGVQGSLNLNNLFNPDCISLLRDNDTLAVQQTQLVLKRQ